MYPTFRPSRRCRMSRRTIEMRDEKLAQASDGCICKLRRVLQVVGCNRQEVQQKVVCLSSTPPPSLAQMSALRVFHRLRSECTGARYPRATMTARCASASSSVSRCMATSFCNTSSVPETATPSCCARRRADRSSLANVQARCFAMSRHSAFPSSSTWF